MSASSNSYLLPSELVEKGLAATRKMRNELESDPALEGTKKQEIQDCLSKLESQLQAKVQPSKEDLDGLLRDVAPSPALMAQAIAFTQLFDYLPSL